MDENWKDINGYEGLYQVSDLGRVASYNRIMRDGRFYRGSIKKLSVDYKGYLTTVLMNYDYKKNSFRVSRLVGIAFIPNPENKPEINHKYGDKLDNRVTSLEWVTGSENIRHAIDTGLNSVVKLNLEKAELIRRFHYSGFKTMYELADLFGVAYNTIRDIINNKTWIR